MRKIIHVDMDAFYASVEQRDNPEYKGKPLVVGYAGDRGVVASASYEARRYGVRSAMSSKVALRKCPHLIFVPGRFDVYHDVSEQIHAIFHEYTDLIEPLSLDEAYLDVTTNFKNMPIASQIASQIRKEIEERTKLTASAGISFNKFLAKIASDYNKPNGQYIVKPKQAEKFVESLNIEKFFGVGKVTAKKMHSLGIKTGLDLKQKKREELIKLFGKVGNIYYEYARAIDNRPVYAEQERKSIGTESTFSSDLDNFEELVTELKGIAIELIERIENNSFEGKTVTLKIKYADFKIISKSRTFNEPINKFEKLLSIAIDLLKQIDLTPKIRLLGLTIKNYNIHYNQLQNSPIQLSIDFDFS